MQNYCSQIGISVVLWTWWLLVYGDWGNAVLQFSLFRWSRINHNRLYAILVSCTFSNTLQYNHRTGGLYTAKTSQLRPFLCVPSGQPFMGAECGPLPSQQWKLRSLTKNIHRLFYTTSKDLKSFVLRIYTIHWHFECPLLWRNEVMWKWKPHPGPLPGLWQ